MSKNLPDAKDIDQKSSDLAYDAQAVVFSSKVY